jgi:hypothetical protein
VESGRISRFGEDGWQKLPSASSNGSPEPNVATWCHEASAWTNPGLRRHSARGGDAHLASGRLSRSPCRDRHPSMRIKWHAMRFWMATGKGIERRRTTARASHLSAAHIERRNSLAFAPVPPRPVRLKPAIQRPLRRWAAGSDQPFCSAGTMLICPSRSRMAYLIWSMRSKPHLQRAAERMSSSSTRVLSITVLFNFPRSTTIIG